MTKKRTRDGKEKQQSRKSAPTNQATTAQDSKNTATKAQRIPAIVHNAAATPPIVQRPPRKKLRRLPDNVSVVKRPIHHPAVPSPFSSAASPKVLYITHTTPFIPTLKRIRRLLTDISKRHAQSLFSNQERTRNHRSRKPLTANGRLQPADVEQEIVDQNREKKGAIEEEVFLKATGRAIERVLQVGVHFQGESDCTVRVEMGSVAAVDDLEIKSQRRDRGIVDEDLATGQGQTSNPIQVGSKTKIEDEEDVPETRIRTLSSVTVAIRLK